MRKPKLLWSLLVLPLLAACSSDEPGTISKGEQQIVDGVYMALNINPYQGDGSRSSTNNPNASNSGEEPGTDVENAIKSALIVITKPNNELIAVGMAPGADKSGSLTGATVNGTTLYQAVAKFDKTALSDFYDDDTSNDINVFVYCNPTNDVISALTSPQAIGTTSWTDLTFDNTKNSGGIWNEEKGFVMTNLNIARRQLPETLSDWSNYNTAVKAFNLSGNNNPGSAGAIDNLTNRGAIKVHRMAARFDFRDGSQIAGIGNGMYGYPFTYQVVKNADNVPIVNVKILSMALANMSTTQYYLGRTSANGLLANATLCGDEMPWIGPIDGNYVVSTNATAKQGPIKEDFSTYFQYPFFSSTGIVSAQGNGWDWVYCDQIVSEEKGKLDNLNQQYYVWRYLTENTIPAPSTLQVNSQSTGVIFKARLLADAQLATTTSGRWDNLLKNLLNYDEAALGSLLQHNTDLDPTLYSLSGNTLYVTWDNVREEALYEAGFDPTKGQNQELDRLAPLYIIVYGDGGVGTVTNDDGDVIYTDNLAADASSLNSLFNIWDAARQTNPSSTAAQNAKSTFKSAATAAGFTLYQSSQDSQTKEWGYYCYYYYWNRHNDNGIDGTMGPMEFAVVRNNVYKLTINSINTLGHPRIPENDPDDPKPDTPDEKSEIYLTVSVDVLPWVVRENAVHF